MFQMVQDTFYSSITTNGTSCNSTNNGSSDDSKNNNSKQQQESFIPLLSKTVNGYGIQNVNGYGIQNTNGYGIDKRYGECGSRYNNQEGDNDSTSRLTIENNHTF